MEDKLFKATREAKKRLMNENPVQFDQVKGIAAKVAKNETLTFAERNILNIYDRRLEKIVRSLT